MLDSKQCEAFLTVAETGSFEQAAKKLYITASAVSLRVQALEKELGILLLNRGRPCTVTRSGEAVMEHLRHARLLEHNLLQNVLGKTTSQFFKIIIASNVDSLATWLLPAISDVLVTEKIAIEVQIDDQSQTYALLESGVVNACISTQEQPMNGCVAESLGMMRYQMMATLDFIHKWFPDGVTREALRAAPAIVFNDKDLLHVDAVLNLYGLPAGTYPVYSIPSPEAFVRAIQLGIGYGMVPELQLKEMHQVDNVVSFMPAAQTDIPLYWHHWKRQSYPLEVLSQYVIKAANKVLMPPAP